jgi:hypothetical protein
MRNYFETEKSRNRLVFGTLFTILLLIIFVPLIINKLFSEAIIYGIILLVTIIVLKLSADVGRWIGKGR